MKQTVTITFDDANHQREFRTFEGFFNWLQAEQQRWTWLDQFPHGNVASHVTQAFETIRQSAVNNQINSQPLSLIGPMVSSNYEPSGWLRHSEGQFAKQIQRIRENQGDSGAAFVFAFVKQQVSLANITEPSHLASCILFCLPELDQPEMIGKRLATERSNYRTSIASQLDRIDAATEERSRSYQKHLHAARRLAIRQLLRTRSLDRSFRDSLSGQSQSAISSIKGVEDTFRVKMGLQAPVKYWEDKAGKHRGSAADAVKRLTWYFPLAAMTFVGAFGLAAWLLLKSDEVHQTVYIIVAAGLASLAALIFWVGRLLTKLYLSQHHLLHDAEERAVMTTTYLALSHDNAASEDDKKIILGALFRPTVDGLVKDDGPSDFSLAGALSRLGAAR